LRSRSPGAGSLAPSTSTSRESSVNRVIGENPRQTALANRLEMLDINKTSVRKELKKTVGILVHTKEISHHEDSGEDSDDTEDANDDSEADNDEDDEDIHETEEESDDTDEENDENAEENADTDQEVEDIEEELDDSEAETEDSEMADLSTFSDIETWQGKLNSN